jgi:hypothetical protein
MEEERETHAIARKERRKGGLKTMPSIFGMKLLLSENFNFCEMLATMMLILYLL